MKLMILIMRMLLHLCLRLCPRAGPRAAAAAAEVEDTAEVVKERAGGGAELAELDDILVSACVMRKLRALRSKCIGIRMYETCTRKWSSLRQTERYESGEPRESYDWLRNLWHAFGRAWA